MNHLRYTVEQLLKDPSFVRWANGEVQAAEALKWNRWVAARETNRQTALRAQQIITGINFEQLRLPDVDGEWENVQSDIVERDRPARFYRRHQVPSRDVWSLVWKAAAVVLVAAFSGLALYLYQDPQTQSRHIAVHTVETGYGEKKTINLSDGSTIILGPGSSLSYKENWLSKPAKKVELEGEAFFSIVAEPVKHRPKFVVQTEDGSAAVWGTRFVVATYDEAGTRVVLEEGEVRIRLAEAGSGKKARLTMHPGEMARFTKHTPRIAVKKVNPKVYTSWTSNRLLFDNTPLSELVNRIKRTYGMNVQVQDPDMLDMKLSGGVDFRSLDALIAAASEVMQISITRADNTVIIKHNTNN